MRKVYSKPLFRLVEMTMSKRFPEFAPYKGNGRSSRKKDGVFCWNVEGVTRVFIEIWLHPSGYDQFYCNFAWTSIGDYPTVTHDSLTYRFPFLEPRTAFNHPETASGIQRLWGDQGAGEYIIAGPLSTFRPTDYKEDKNAGVAEFMRRTKLQDDMTDLEGEQLVAPLVNELFEKLAQYVIPYLREYVEYVRKNKVAVNR